MPPVLYDDSPRLPKQTGAVCCASRLGELLDPPESCRCWEVIGRTSRTISARILRRADRGGRERQKFGQALKLGDAKFFTQVQWRLCRPSLQGAALESFLLMTRVAPGRGVRLHDRPSVPPSEGRSGQRRVDSDRKQCHPQRGRGRVAVRCWLRFVRRRQTPRPKVFLCDIAQSRTCF